MRRPLRRAGNLFFSGQKLERALFNIRPFGEFFKQIIEIFYASARRLYILVGKVGYRAYPLLVSVGAFEHFRQRTSAFLQSLFLHVAIYFETAQLYALVEHLTAEIFLAVEKHIAFALHLLQLSLKLGKPFFCFAAGKFLRLFASSHDFSFVGAYFLQRLYDKLLNPQTLVVKLVYGIENCFVLFVGQRKPVSYVRKLVLDLLVGLHDHFQPALVGNAPAVVRKII